MLGQNSEAVRLVAIQGNKSCSGSEVMSLFVICDDVTLVPLPENDENFLYFPYKSENAKVSISGVVLHESF